MVATYQGNASVTSGVRHDKLIINPLVCFDLQTPPNISEHLRGLHAHTAFEEEPEGCRYDAP